MSKEALAKVVQRAISDAGFRRQLNSDPAGALRGFDLSADEVSAVRTGDAGRLTTLGIDQRMSKSFALGGAIGATRMAASDLSAGSSAVIDDGSSAGGTIVPHDPESVQTADDDAGASTRSAVRDDPDGLLAAEANRVAGGTASVRTGDDWKFTDRGGGMANYPAHDGLAGPSGVASARAGDDWARADRAQLDDSARAGSARLDDASREAPTPIRDDPDGFLAGQAAKSDTDGVLTSGGTAFVDDSVDPAYQPTAGTSDGTSFVDESEAYLTQVGYDPSAANKAVTDAHDRTWSGDDIAGPSSAEGGATSGDSGDAPNITP